MTRDDDIYLHSADQLAARLCRNALWSGNRCNWIGPSMEPLGMEWQVVQKTCGPDLYAGTSGIALFLGYLYARTGERQYLRTAEGAMCHALAHIDDIPASTRAGVYSGLLGVIHTGLALEKMTGSLNWRGKSDPLKTIITARPEREGLDIIMGSAGAIPFLISLSEELGNEAFLQLAVDHGRQLLAAARREGEAWSWRMMPGMPPLTGFAHGAAGAAWAFMELAQASGDVEFRRAAENALRWEQRYFSAEHDNWPDLRDHSAATGHPGDPVYGLGWCHGAPGIGLSRLRVYALTGENEYRLQAEAALRCCTRFLQHYIPESGMDFTFCHGLAGLTELLIYASEIFETPEYRRLAEQSTQKAMSRYAANVAPWPCGIPGAGEAPGLMLGIAGIGYYLLRLCSGDAPPSVLMIGGTGRPA